MKIKLPSDEKIYNFPFRVIGSAGRYDSVTDCAFLDTTHIICADRQMAKLYLIHYDMSANSFTILDSKTCITNGKPQHFDLITVKDYNLYATILDSTVLTCKITDLKFGDIKSHIVDLSHNYHGLCYSDKDTIYLTNLLGPILAEFNLETCEKKLFYCANGQRMKDVTLIDSNYLIAISCEGGPVFQTYYSARPSNLKQPQRVARPYNSRALIYNRHSGELVGEHILINTHVDSCIYSAPFCYITCTRQDGSGFLLRCKVDASYNFIEMTELACAKFPHGISVHGGLLAYSSYADSAVYIHKLSEDGNLLP